MKCLKLVSVILQSFSDHALLLLRIVNFNSMSESLRVDEPAFEDDGGFHDYTIATALEK